MTYWIPRREGCGWGGRDWRERDDGEDLDDLLWEVRSPVDIPVVREVASIDVIATAVAAAAADASAAAAAPLEDAVLLLLL
mmetsp:Transcript_41617/g.87350  ORF Transcript_41617/g.87350 Transcript_41617/m.87350 type:complete len:81 (+) Transcript_41617:88-330(+)